MAHPDLPKVIASYLAAYQAMDVAGLLACLTDDIHFENLSNHAGQVSLDGLDHFKEIATQSAHAFTSRTQTVLDVVADPSQGRYAVQIEFRGVLASDMGEDLQAGTEIAMQGISLMTVTGDKISRIIDFS